jgi:hypothetical protein
MSYPDFEGRPLDLTDREVVAPVGSSLAEIRERLSRHTGWIPERNRPALCRALYAWRLSRRLARRARARARRASLDLPIPQSGAKRIGTAR